MSVMKRVSTLVRANLNDLIDKAEDPGKMIKQLILDMEAQLTEVKKQVAIAIADKGLLEQKQKENDEITRDWMHKAELAVDKEKDDLARSALVRYQAHLRLADSFQKQVTEQAAQVDNLKAAYRKLEQKLEEARAKSELLLAQHRRARAVGRTRDVQRDLDSQSSGASFERMEQKVAREAAIAQAKTEMANETLDDKFAALENDAEVEKLLSEIKTRRSP